MNQNNREYSKSDYFSGMTNGKKIGFAEGISTGIPLGRAEGIPIGEKRGMIKALAYFLFFLSGVAAAVALYNL